MYNWWAIPELWKYLLSLEVYEEQSVRGVEVQAFNNIYLEAKALEEYAEKSIKDTGHSESVRLA